MNKNSNTYIIVYTVVMVVVVAAVLAVASLKLKPLQDQNARVEKKGDVLNSVGLAPDAATVKDKAAYIDAQYEKHITDAFLVDAQGRRIEGDAFVVLTDLKSEYSKTAAERRLPVFVSEKDGERHLILPVYGAGLWDAVWGYVALDEDCNTIYGVVFDHAGETPGLGAEISTPKFTGQFIGKKLFDNGVFAGITVLKGAGASQGNPHAVDAISGGTITSRAVESMIKQYMKEYEPFFDRYKALAGESNQNPDRDETLKQDDNGDKK